MRLLILFLPILLFSYEIKFDKTFVKDLSHDILKGYLVISIVDDTEKLVNERLEKFNSKIKSHNQVEKELERFDIRPKYRHANSTPKVSGYLGELRYKVSSNLAKPMNKLIVEVSGMKESRDTSVALYNLDWSVKKETYDIVLDILRYESINWAINYTKTLSNDLNTQCKLKDINIDTKSGKSPLIEKYAFSNEEVVVKKSKLPIANQEKVVIHVTYRLDCK